MKYDIIVVGTDYDFSGKLNEDGPLARAFYAGFRAAEKYYNIGEK